MVRRIGNTIEHYMVMFLPLIFSVGRFIPGIETIATLFTMVILIIDQCRLKRNFIKYIVICCLFITSGIMGTEYSMHIDHIKPMIIIFLAFDATNGRLYNRILTHIKKYQDIILKQLIVVLIINLVLMFSSIGYSSAYGEMWGLNAYQGMYYNPHQCAYHICALLVILLWIGKIRFKPYYYWIMIGFEYCVLITGARVPTVLALILGVIFIIDHFVRPNSIKDGIEKILRYLILVLLAVVVIYIIMKYTNFGYKILTGISDQNFDNGRGHLRERDLELFMNSNIMHKLFGYGTDAVIAYHGSFAYSPAIWSHNDFSQVMVGMGALMLLIYSFYWLKYLGIAIKKSFMYVIVVITLIIVAYLNGMYIHTRFTFVMPLLFMYMESRRKNTDKSGVNYNG